MLSSTLTVTMSGHHRCRHVRRNENKIFFVDIFLSFRFDDGLTKQINTTTTTTMNDRMNE